MVERICRWYVVHTRPNSEERARSHLEAQNFHCFLPRLKKAFRHARRVAIVLRPLFPRYLFVQIDLGADRWLSIRSTIGVNGLIGQGDQPTPVPEGVVEGLIARSATDGILTIDAPTLAPGDSVRVVAGPFVDQRGSFERMAEHARVAVLLELMGRSVRILVQREALEPA